MGYALFSQNKLALNSTKSTIELQQAQRMNQNLQLAADKSAFQMDLSSSEQAIAEDKQEVYEAFANEEITKDDKENLINELDNELKILQEETNRELRTLEVKEAALQMEIKSLDTQHDAIAKQLEAVEQAEGEGIEQSTPKFSGLS